MKSLVDLGSRVELLVDEWLMDRSHQVALRLNPPVRGEVVLVADRPWEGVDSGYYTVFQDDSRFRLYYRGQCPHDLDAAQVTCCAHSEDGIHFARPELGLWEFAGSRANNIVWQGVEAHNFAPFLDSRADCRPDERYKAVAGVSSKLWAFASADGLRWRKLQEEPVITQGAFDSLNVAFWDRVAQVYRCYSRSWTGGGYEGVRAIQSCTSEDFVHWSEPQPNQYAASAPVEHFYTNATFPCPGAEHILLSFPKRFLPSRKKLAEHEHEGVSDAVFMSSRDGVHWDRTFLEAWVRPGPDPKNWTQRGNMPAWGILETGPQELSLYISEHYNWPDNRLRRLTVRRHGFASMHAGPARGEFTTRPLTFAGSHLYINYSTSAAGWVQVEVQDEQGRALPGLALSDMEPLYGDELDARIEWKDGQDLAELQGRPVRLRFVMADADVYALRTGE